MGVHAVWTGVNLHGGRPRHVVGLFALIGGVAAAAIATAFWLLSPPAAPASDLDSSPAPIASETSAGPLVTSNRWVRVDTGEGNGSAAQLAYRRLANQRPVPIADDQDQP